MPKHVDFILLCRLCMTVLGTMYVYVTETHNWYVESQKRTRFNQRWVDEPACTVKGWDCVSFNCLRSFRVGARDLLSTSVFVAPQKAARLSNRLVTNGLFQHSTVSCFFFNFLGTNIRKTTSSSNSTSALEITEETKVCQSDALKRHNPASGKRSVTDAPLLNAPH